MICNHIDMIPCECGCGVLKCFNCDLSKMEIDDMKKEMLK